MNKTKKYAINGFLIGVTANGILNIINQTNKQKPFNWNELFKASVKGGLAGGITGLALGAIKDNDMSKILVATGGTSGFINEILNNYTSDDLILPQKAQELQEKLYYEFKDYLSEYPTLNGSIIKGTAIQNSDIDIQVKFNKNAGTIKEIRNLVEFFLTEKLCDNSLIKIRSQNHSIGLVFDIQNEEKRIDIVPMREIENGRGDTYLFSLKNNSIKKTNSKIHINKLKFTKKQKHIIKLLKGWKLDNELHLPSILIEHIVKKVFNDSTVPRGIEKALLFVIKYIANNIVFMKIVDPANTNNIISNLITYEDKEYLKNFCLKMLYEIEKDRRNIIDYFKY